MPPSLLSCGGCQQSIGDRFFLKAIEQYWHEDCLSCDLCGCRLGEVGRRLYYKLGRKLCRRDYLRSVWWCCKHRDLIKQFVDLFRITRHEGCTIKNTSEVVIVARGDPYYGEHKNCCLQGLSCCYKSTVDHQMYINTQLKIVHKVGWI